MSRIISSETSDLEVAAEALARGKLVALPTETVYGLGGNALDATAVEKIYAVKGRPGTDPLICHTDSLERAVKLWHPDWDPPAVALASRIGAALWPGPLTIVCKAHPSLPVCVTGGSGFIGARIPRHPVALRLLHLVPFPVAAPSANTFGHVSPTTAQHVFNDLFSRDPELLIVDGGSCTVGIESTVIKVNDVNHIEVLRRGMISVSDLQRVIAAEHPNTQIVVRDTRSKYSGGESVPMDGPGQLLTHYSPGVPASLITPASVKDCGASVKDTVVLRGSITFAMSRTIVVDFNGILKQFQGECLAYRDLSVSGSAAEACYDVFEALRWSEQVAGAEDVIFPFISEWSQTGDLDLLEAVEDRLFRAASGTIAFLKAMTD